MTLKPSRSPWTGRRRASGKTRRGVTLAELLIAASLVGVAGLAFLALVASSQRSLRTAMALGTGQSEAALAVTHLRTHLLRGTAVTLTAPPDTSRLTVVYDEGGPSPTSHTVQYEQDPNGDLQWTLDGTRQPVPLATSLAPDGPDADAYPDGLVVTITRSTVTVTLRVAREGRTLAVTTTILGRGIPPH